MIDLTRGDMSEAVAEAFRYPTLVLATTTYNGDIFPPMREFIHCLVERNFCKRRIAFIENGSWATAATKVMREKLDECKELEFVDVSVKIASVLSEDSILQLEKMVSELCREE